ncbi:hypothetical protein PG989_000894 [Apiospora arundinis]
MRLSSVSFLAALTAQGVKGLHAPSPNQHHVATPVAATPTPADPQQTPPGGAQAGFQPTYQAQYYCGTSSLVNHTLGNSPLLADCQALLTNVTGSPGYWTLTQWPGDNVMSPMLTNGTCQLVIGKMGDDVNQNVTIGNGDIENFVAMMINQKNGTCSQTGRCSAWGVTSCISRDGGDVALSWEFVQPQP